MHEIKKDYIEKVYAGWLGKIIGVRHGAPIEGWTYEKINKIYGKITDYLVDYRDFAADDDTNGPIFFLRALEDYTYTSDITSEQIGLTWLNYAPYEHGFYWWGGYGISTEHTAYLNLKSGIKAPYSGSVELNGPAVAEQIGGQIFIDTWGLVIPGNYNLAAEYAKKAASVAHGRNGVYGGMFIAACISAAFNEQNIEKIIEAGLSVIPEDSEYTRMTKAVLYFYHKHPKDWREAFKYVKDNFGYDRYPGTCHIIPNSAVIVLSLLYCDGDFSKAINICNMCGWDTDCNVANVGTIMGVRNGLEGIDYNKWRKPINDFLACSSVIGSLNILDIPWCAYYIANLGYKIAGQEPPAELKDIFEGKAAKFNFELPGSTHAFRLIYNGEQNLEWMLNQTYENSYTGKGSLKLIAKPLNGENEIKVYHKTYYRPKDFHDSRYDPSFSPILYPGQMVSAALMIPEDLNFEVKAILYVKDGNTNRYIEGSSSTLKAGHWQKLSFQIPRLEGACLEEMGIKFIINNCSNEVLVAYIDDFDISKGPDYTIDFTKEKMEAWNIFHHEVSQFTYLKGLWELENGELSGSGSDFAEAYTGYYDWTDYSFQATLRPLFGSNHNLNFRVQGAIRSYAVGLAYNNKLVLYKNVNGYTALKSIDFHWTIGNEYTFKVEVKSNKITVSSNDTALLIYEDNDNPYLKGQIGVSLQNGSHCHYKNFIITRI